jgi:hypothetical protein
MRSANALLLVLLLGRCSQKARVATAITKLSDSPSKFVLYSLDPGSLEHNESVQTATVFHDYGILGRAEITDADERQALVRALARGARETDGSIGGCFNPRHGLHVEQSGGSADFVICFECLQVHAHGFRGGNEFLTSATPQSTFDESLRRHDLPLAPK